MKERKAHNPYKIYVKFIIIFFIFGLLVSLITTYVHYRLEYKKIDERIQKEAKNLSYELKSKIAMHLKHIENNLLSIQNNPIFIAYLTQQDRAHTQALQALFLSKAYANPNFFQIRYLDEQGQERVRIDRARDGRVFSVEEEHLQNKLHRYYYLETASTPLRAYWQSKFDLNIEHKQIEKPIRPTYRVATPIYEQEEFKGIVIINVDMSDLLETIRYNHNFDIFIVDQEGFFIIAPQKKKDFSRYQKSGFTLDRTFSKLQASKGLFSYSLANQFKNGEQLKLLLSVKENFIEHIHDDNLNFALTLGLIVLLSSIPIGVLVSIPAANLEKLFSKIYHENLLRIAIIDEYVLLVEVNLAHEITYISQALLELTGYSSEEVLGKNPHIFSSGAMKEGFYKQLWQTLHRAETWQGEFKNRKKNGDYFWVKTTISPNYKGEVLISYTAISEDISDKKVIEKLSQTDGLTKLFNRLKIDDVLQHEFEKFRRYGASFSIILLDIDYFKRVNDRFGHQVGDSVLIELATILRENTRRVDSIGRWGGEEFMVICPQTSKEGALILAQKLRQKVETFEFSVAHQQTISLGVAQIESNENLEKLIKRGDENLYHAKERGRNQVVG